MELRATVEMPLREADPAGEPAYSPNEIQRDTGGLAHVVQDELKNSYQRRT